jgi:phage baseplate assembly protein W
MAQAIALPFRFTSSGGVNTTVDEKKIWSDRVLSAIFTRTSERVMNYAYGSPVSGLVFEPENVAIKEAKLSISEAFTKWLPNLRLTSVTAAMEMVELADAALVISIEYVLPSGEKTTTVARVKSGTFTRTGVLIEEITRG